MLKNSDFGLLDPVDVCNTMGEGPLCPVHNINDQNKQGGSEKLQLN